MDQGVIESLKRRYRKSLLEKLVIEDQEIIEFVKKITIKDAVYTSAAAWDEVPNTTLAKSWHHLLIPIDHDQTNDTTDDDVSPAAHSQECMGLLQQLDSNLTNEDGLTSEDAGYQLLSDDDIINQVTGQQSDVDKDFTDEDEDEAHLLPGVPSCGQVADMLDQYGMTGGVHSNISNVTKEY